MRKKDAPLSRMGFLVIGVMVLLSLAWPIAQEANGQEATLEGSQFLVIVDSSFGSQFVDCMGFGYGGTFMVGGIDPSWTGTFTEEAITPTILRFDASQTTSAGSLTVDFRGVVLNMAILIARGLNDHGDTFDVKGVATSPTRCNRILRSPVEERSGLSPYSR